MLSKIYFNLSGNDIVNQANEDMSAYENGGTYSVVTLADIQRVEKYLQRAEFTGTAGGKEARLRAQQILTRDAGIKFAEKPSMIQERQGITEMKRMNQLLNNKSNRLFRNVGAK